MKKRFGAIYVVASLVCALSMGCASTATQPAETKENTTTVAPAEETSASDTEAPEGGEILDGGIDMAEAVGNITEEEKAIFEEATATMLGSEMKPLTVLGTQVVAGVNYAYLCTSKVVNGNQTYEKLVVVTVSMDLDGNVSVLDTVDFSEDKFVDASEPSMDGGWTVTEDEALSTMPQTAASALSTAMEEYVGVSFVPYAYIHKQIVAGTNFTFVCKATTVTAEPVSYMCLVTVYEDVEGSCTITDIKSFDVAGLFAE